MAITIKSTIAKAGRSYKVDNNGASDVSARYQLVLSAPLDIDELPTSFRGVPAIGSAHPDRLGYYVAGYEVTQPDANAKSTLDVLVKYAPMSTNSSPDQSEGMAQGSTAEVTEWGWDDGTGDKELVTACDAKATPVLNSAGDPFDSVPTVYVPTPTFTKVVRTNSRQTFLGYSCTVNDAAATIGTVEFPARTLLCTIAERKLIGEYKLPYEYTIHLRYRSNIVLLGGAAATAEIGWDTAIVDAGMREIDRVSGGLKLIQTISKETGQPANVTSPELLDGHGHAISRSADGAAQPFVLVFQAYPRTAFPQWFYSEPPTPAPPPQNGGNT